VLRRAVDSLRAVELFFQDGLDLVCDRLGLPRPFNRPHHAFVLVEAAAGTDPTAELAAAIEALGDLADSAVAADDRAARELWRYREGHTEAINQLGAPHKLDVTLPVSSSPRSSKKCATRSLTARRTRRCGCSAMRPTATST